MDITTAYRTLIAAAKERQNTHLRFIEPLPGGKEAEEWSFAIQSKGVAPFDLDEIKDGYAGPEDIGISAAKTESFCTELNAIHECISSTFKGTTFLGETITVDVIDAASNDLVNLVEAINSLHTRLSALEKQP